MSFYWNLLDLKENGYQPTYNGRPSCPFCENFIDEEETHDKNCPLIKFLKSKEAKKLQNA